MNRNTKFFFQQNALQISSEKFKWFCSILSAVLKWETKCSLCALKYVYFALLLNNMHGFCYHFGWKCKFQSHWTRHWVDGGGDKETHWIHAVKDLGALVNTRTFWYFLLRGSTDIYMYSIFSSPGRTINLFPLMYFFRGCGSEMVVLSYCVSLLIWISGKLGLCSQWWYALLVWNFECFTHRRKWYQVSVAGGYVPMTSYIFLLQHQNSM